MRTTPKIWLAVIASILLIFVWMLKPEPVQQCISKPVGKIGSLNSVSIKNGSNKNKTISFSINERHFFSQYSDIVERAVTKSTTGEDSIKLVWKFTSTYSYHFYPVTASIWLDDPLIFFNSAGFGFCHDVAAVNQQLWKIMGYNARMWDLKEHVVSEAFQGDKWKMLDSDIGCYYHNSSFQIASLEEIYDEPNIVVERRIQNDTRVIEMNYKENEWKNLSRIFSQKANLVGVIPLNSSLKKKVEFELPPNSTLTIGQKVAGLMTGIIEGENHLIPVYSNIVLNVPHISNWDVDLPLILHDIKGEGQVILNGHKYDIGDSALTACIRERKEFINSIFIKEAKELRLVLLFNEKIFELSEKNILKVYGADLQGITIEASNAN